MMELGVATVMTAGTVYFLHPLAARLGLIDHPGDRRKIHLNSVATIGGLAIFVGLFLAALLHLVQNQPSADLAYGLFGAIILVLVGALDDRFNLGYKVRLFAQAGAALILVLGAGVQLRVLGDLFGFGPVGLGWLTVPISVFAVVGLINAFNMIDGIDGLAGSLALIALISVLLELPGHAGTMLFLIPVIVATLLPYLAFNLELPGFKRHKIFLGDAGSMLLGYLVVWALINATQTPSGISPVAALWLVAIPLMDTFAVMGRRLRKGRSPFTADHHHLHHLLIRISGSPRKALAIILVLALGFAITPQIARLIGLSESALFYLALATFLCYIVLQSRLPCFHRRLRRTLARRQYQPPSSES
ncbi:MAG: undecaprenyl-phosphate alpha-N-acetylglucosaminyl 1-phosphate transferase [Chromatiaceae bacterium]|nr:undecaprenyl-phosphate alpha-N-acetylglucosaminyl 1-phosphate transferase [Chromatiaceae bacterium]